MGGWAQLFPKRKENQKTRFLFPNVFRLWETPLERKIDEVAKKADELVKSGYNPIPHFPARSIKDSNELKDYVTMCKDSGVKQALVIGGGREPAQTEKRNFGPKSGDVLVRARAGPAFFKKKMPNSSFLFIPKRL